MRRGTFLVSFATAILAVQLLADLPALACTYARDWHPFEQTAGEEGPPDEVPPEPVVLSVGEITRGTGGGCGCSGTSSCDDIGFIQLHFDRLPAEEEGFLLETRNGPPLALRLPDTPFSVSNKTLSQGWVDGATRRQEPIDFEVRVSAVDSWGRSSPWSEWVRVHDPGRL